MKTILLWVMLMLVVPSIWALPDESVAQRPTVQDLTLAEEVLTGYTVVFVATMLATNPELKRADTGQLIMTGVIVVTRIVLHVLRWHRIRNPERLP